ncbi:integrase, catalytic region, zinc finger, CCHC-type containing protein [Tanacetum coccineum]
MDSGLVVPSFLPSNDLISSLKKEMAFINTSFISRYPPTNNQLRTSSNPRNQETIQDGRVIMQTVQGRQTQGYASSGPRSNATGLGVNRNGGTNTSGQTKEKMLLAKASESRVALNEEQMAFLADNGDTASAVLMAKLSAYDSNVHSEVLTHDTYLDNHVINQKTENAVVQDTSSSAQQDALIISVIEEMSNQVAKIKKFDLDDREKYIDSQLQEVIVDRNVKVADFQNQIHSLKLQLSATVESHKTLSTTVDVLKKEYKAKEHDALSVAKEALKLAEDNRLKMHAKQNDPIAKDKKVNIAPIDYAALNKLSEHFGLAKEITDMKEVFNQMETEVAKCSVERKIFEIQKKELLIENDHLLELIISQDLVHTAVNTLAAIADYQNMKKSYLGEYNENLELQAFFEINELKAQLEAKNNSIRKLKDHIATLKGKSVSEGDKSENISKVIALRMYKLDLEPLSPKLLKNREAHVDYLKHTQENADTLCEIVEQARALRPLDIDFDSACKFATRIQELLVYVGSTCPSSSKQSEKLIAVTPINKNMKVSSTSASGSKPPGNTKKNRISRPTSSNKKNIVKDHIRSVKSSLNKKNRVSELVCNANVKHYMLNANSELICSTCNECTFDVIHDLYVLDFLNDVNMRVKSKSVMSKKKKFWKSTGKVFTNARYRWIPTGRTFTIDRNKCPLTRITSTTAVSPKKPLLTTVVKETPSSSNNSGKLKDITNIGSSSKSKSVESKNSNNSKPNENWGSNVSTSPSCSRVHFRSFNSSFGHNLFSVSQFCDSNLEVAFRKHTCYVRDLEGVDLLKGSRGSNLYTMSLEEMMQSSPICLFSKAYKTKSCLWHRRLSHLNFGVINHLAKQSLVRGLPKLKYQKDHLSIYLWVETLQGLVPIYLWAKAVATSCYTQNHYLIRKRHNKTPYELLHDRKPDLTYFHVFGALCYPTNDSEYLRKLKPKADIRILIGYAPAKKAYQIYNKQTRLIMETMQVKFDELTSMTSENFGSGPELQLMTQGTYSSGLVHNYFSSAPYVPPTTKD